MKRIEPLEINTAKRISIHHQERIAANQGQSILHGTSCPQRDIFLRKQILRIIATLISTDDLLLQVSHTEYDAPESLFQKILHKNIEEWPSSY